MTPLDGYVETSKWVFLALLTAAPFVVGYLTTKMGVMLGWVVFGVCAVPLALFLIFGEAMRQSTNSSGFGAYWHFVPIGCLVLGRAVGSYFR